MKKPKRITYYWQACDVHPDRVWIKAHEIPGALCEVLAFNGQTAEENAEGMLLMLEAVGSVIAESITKQLNEQGGGSCDEAQRD